MCISDWWLSLSLNVSIQYESWVPVRLAFLLQKELLAQCFNQHNSISELDALGDELLADEDNSYLDEAASAPAIPEVTPTDTKNKVSPLIFNSKIQFCLFWVNHICVGCLIFGILNILNKKSVLNVMYVMYVLYGWMLNRENLRIQCTKCSSTKFKLTRMTFCHSYKTLSDCQ